MSLVGLELFKSTTQSAEVILFALAGCDKVFGGSSCLETKGGCALFRDIDKDPREIIKGTGEEPTHRGGKGGLAKDV